MLLAGLDVQVYLLSAVGAADVGDVCHRLLLGQDLFLAIGEKVGDADFQGVGDFLDCADAGVFAVLERGVETDARHSQFSGQFFLGYSP